MSVAFTKEEDSESAAAALPDRPISPHPNLVTPEGLEQLDAGLAAAQAAYAVADSLSSSLVKATLMGALPTLPLKSRQTAKVPSHRPKTPAEKRAL